jgi:hypothetical protein
LFNPWFLFVLELFEPYGISTYSKCSCDHDLKELKLFSLNSILAKLLFKSFDLTKYPKTLVLKMIYVSITKCFTQNSKGGEPTLFLSKHLEPLVLNLFYKNKPKRATFQGIFLKHLSSRTFVSKQVFWQIYPSKILSAFKKNFFLVLKLLFERLYEIFFS